MGNAEFSILPSLSHKHRIHIIHFKHHFLLITLETVNFPGEFTAILDAHANVEKSCKRGHSLLIHTSRHPKQNNARCHHMLIK